MFATRLTPRTSPVALVLLALGACSSLFAYLVSLSCTARHLACRAVASREGWSRRSLARRWNPGAKADRFRILLLRPKTGRSSLFAFRRGSWPAADGSESGRLVIRGLVVRLNHPP